MWTFSTIRGHSARSGQGIVRLITTVQTQPSWVTRAALGVGLLVFTAVLFLLVVPALVLAAIAFLVLSFWASAHRFVRKIIGLEASGRRNVKVITRN